MAAAPQPASPALEDIVGTVVPAVASIQAGQARGTGFFIRPDTVLTNAHVVEGHTSVQLQAGDAKYTARVVTTSSGTDLAMLQVYNANPRQAVLRLGSASTARVGQEVIAIGSALGVLQNTVTRGIVSAVRQAGPVTLVQTDAAINPGNSGGPLIDRTGQVIGINSMAVASRIGQGLGFAVAIDHAMQLLNGQSSISTSTPMSGLNQLMGAPSDGDQLRERGAQAYAKVLEWAARNGDQLDNYWNRYSATCLAGATPMGSRAWFAVYEPGGVRISTTSSYNCTSWLDTITSQADQIRAEVTKATEQARQTGVYPGTMRDLRRKYRMDWAGWS
jgi:V8-like Glu-specific endopeptidase